MTMLRSALLLLLLVLLPALGAAISTIWNPMSSARDEWYLRYRQHNEVAELAQRGIGRAPTPVHAVVEVRVRRDDVGRLVGLETRRTEAGSGEVLEHVRWTAAEGTFTRSDTRTGEVTTRRPTVQPDLETVVMDSVGFLDPERRPAAYRGVGPGVHERRLPGGFGERVLDAAGGLDERRIEVHDTGKGRRVLVRSDFRLEEGEAARRAWGEV